MKDIKNIDLCQFKFDLRFVASFLNLMSAIGINPPNKWLLGVSKSMWANWFVGEGEETTESDYPFCLEVVNLPGLESQKIAVDLLVVLAYLGWRFGRKWRCA